MKREKLEEFLDRNVEVKLFDNSIYRGVLKKTDDNLQRYGKKKYYYCDSYSDSNTIFRCSHVKNVRKL